VGIDEAPHLNIDIPRFGVPAKMRSAWQRSTEATYWDQNGVLQRAAPHEPILKNTYDGSSWSQEGLLVQQSVKNRINHRVIGSGGWSASSGASRTTGQPDIENGTNATLIEDPNTGATEYYEYTESVPDESLSHTVFLFVPKDSDTSRYPLLRMEFLGGSTELSHDMVVDTSAGTITSQPTSDAGHAWVEDRGSYWKLRVQVRNNQSGNTSLRIRIYPAWNADGSTSSDASVTGSIVVDAPCLYRQFGGSREGYPAHPILTDIGSYPTMVTRDKDRVSIPIPFLQDPYGGYIETIQWDHAGSYRRGLSGAYMNFHLSGDTLRGRSLFSYTQDSGGNLGGVLEGLQYDDYVQYDNFGLTKAAVNHTQAPNVTLANRFTIDGGALENVEKGGYFVFKRMYVWPLALSDTQKSNLFNHDFSV
jgi:hypothetical protein